MAYKQGKYLGCVSAFEVEDGSLMDTLELIVDLIAKYGKDAQLVFIDGEYEIYGPKIKIEKVNYER